MKIGSKGVIMQESNSPINWQEILKITNHKPELAKEMVSMLAGELPDIKMLIESALKNKNQPDLINHLHKLHGSCCYCGVTKLRQLTAHIEKQLKTNGISNSILSSVKYETVLNPLFRDLFAEIDLILNYINQQAITL